MKEPAKFDRPAYYRARQRALGELARLHPADYRRLMRKHRDAEGERRKSA